MFMLLPLQGVGLLLNFTQGDALGYVLIGLSARFAHYLSNIHILMAMGLSGFLTFLRQWSFYL